MILLDNFGFVFYIDQRKFLLYSNFWLLRLLSDVVSLNYDGSLGYDDGGGDGYDDNFDNDDVDDG